VALLLGWAGLD